MIDMDLVDDGWRQRLDDMASKANSEVLIISPYVTTNVALRIFNSLLKRRVDCKLITRLKGMDFLQGASSMEAISGLIRAGVKVKALKDLHAKVYLFDYKTGVITSANLTCGGFRNVEWGMCFTHDECHEPFYKGRSMWQKLKNLVTIANLEEIEAAIRIHKPSKDAPEQIPAELGDWGEELNNYQQDNEIDLIADRDRNRIQDAINELTSFDKRFSRGKDYKNLMSELDGTDFRSISIKSYLWLLGWCNTGGSYKSSEELARDLAIKMFAHFPPQYLHIDGNKYDLKNYRYGTREIPFKDEIIAAHLDRINNQ